MVGCVAGVPMVSVVVRLQGGMKTALATLLPRGDALLGALQILGLGPIVTAVLVPG